MFSDEPVGNVIKFVVEGPPVLTAYVWLKVWSHVSPNLIKLNGRIYIALLMEKKLCSRKNQTNMSVNIFI